MKGANTNICTKHTHTQTLTHPQQKPEHNRRAHNEYAMWERVCVPVCLEPFALDLFASRAVLS